MANIIVPGKNTNGRQRQPRGPFSLTRNRAWIFALGSARMLQKPRARAIDGESFKVVRFFPAGQPIPSGEGDRCQQASLSATEFFYCREVTIEHMRRVAKHVKGAAYLPSVAFWIEHVAQSPGEEAWEVKFALPQKHHIADALVLKEKLGSRTMLMMAERIFKLDNSLLIP